MSLSARAEVGFGAGGINSASAGSYGTVRGVGAGGIGSGAVTSGGVYSTQRAFVTVTSSNVVGVGRGGVDSRPATSVIPTVTLRR